MIDTSHIKAKVILHSKFEASPAYLVTFELEYPRYIHSELMTHRVFSRNAQSSRAIPVERSIKIIEDSNWYPIFMVNKKGMSAEEYVFGEDLEKAKGIWDNAKKEAIESARNLMNQGVHKQVVNRLLEPFSTIKVIVSTTELYNFFSLRISEDAQQEIQVLAIKMKEALESSTPTLIGEGGWHIPYLFDDEKESLSLDTKLKLSVARCARVSYLSHDSKKDIDKDLELHDHLLSSRHMSPFEHQAIYTDTPRFYNNFYSFKQYRQLIDESQSSF